MKTYRAKVEQGEDGWLVATVTNLRGAVTQGRDMNELAYMVRDCIECMTETKRFAVELVVPPTVPMSGKKTPATKKRARRAA